MENKKKHHVVISGKSLLILFILILFLYKHYIDNKTKLVDEIVLVIIFILLSIINININVDFINLVLFNYINILYIFLIIYVSIIIIFNNLGYSIYTKLLIRFTFILLITLFFIDYYLLKGKMSEWLLIHLTNNNNEEDYQENAILLLDDALNYVLFFIFLYGFLKIITYLLKNLSNQSS